MRKRKQAREYASVTRRFYRPEMTICLTCQTPLRRYLNEQSSHSMGLYG
jgi:uncharacterized protein with PIN domain